MSKSINPKTLSVLGSLALPVLALAQSTATSASAASSVVSDDSKFFASVIGYIGGLTVFAVGLWQYRRGDYWRRAEFLATEMKAFFADSKVSVALILIDWGVRYVDLGVKAGAAKARHRGDETLVDRKLQCSALRPHSFIYPVPKAGAAPDTHQAPAPSDLIVAPSDRVQDTESAPLPLTPAAAETSSPTAQPSVQPAIAHAPQILAGTSFLPEEAAIRDCYDKLLDGFERFGNYAAGKLLAKKDIDPYLGYWVADITNTRCDGDDALWTLCLLAYIDFYAFGGVQALFAQFGYDLSVEGRLATDFREHSSDKEYATELIQHVILEKRRRATTYPSNL